jgi:hypothetical protein
MDFSSSPNLNDKEINIVAESILNCCIIYLLKMKWNYFITTNK